MTPNGYTSVGTVVLENGNDAWGGLDSHAGLNYLSIQGSGSYVEQRISGLIVGNTYEVHFLAASRPGYGNEETLKVLIDGGEIWESTHPDHSFVRYSAVFSAPATDVVLRVENDSPGGDQSIFCDALAIISCTDCVHLHPDQTEAGGAADHSRLCADIHTEDHYDYTDHVDELQTPLGPMRLITYSVAASNDAHVAFFDTSPDLWSGNGHEHYEIVMSGWGNTLSAIRESSQGTNQVTSSTPGLLSMDEARPFWARAANGFVQLGSGSVVGEGILMEWQDPQPLNPTHFAVATGWGSTGDWHLCVVDGDPAPGGSVEFHHSSGDEIQPSVVNGGFDLDEVESTSGEHRGDGYVYACPVSDSRYFVLNGLPPCTNVY